MLTVMAIINKGAMNVVVHLSLWDGGASFKYMPRNDTAVFQGETIPSPMIN